MDLQNEKSVQKITTFKTILMDKNVPRLIREFCEAFNLEYDLDPNNGVFRVDTYEGEPILQGIWLKQCSATSIVIKIANQLVERAKKGK